MTTLVVPEYDIAREFFVDALGFALVEDKDMGGGKRWLVVEAPDGGRLLLAKAVNDDQRSSIGNQTGGRVAFFLETDDFTASHNRIAAAGCTFHETARQEPYGTVAVFSDPFGNRWDLIEPKEAA